MQSIECRDIAGFEGLYLVGDDGTVHSLRNGRDLRPYNSTMYKAVTLYSGSGKKTRHLVHHLVADAFLAAPKSEMIRHLNGKSWDNRAENLSYGTYSENTLDSVAHGTHRNALVTHCPNRHPYDDENTTVRPGGQRLCNECNRQRVKAVYQEVGYVKKYATCPTCDKPMLYTSVWKHERTAHATTRPIGVKQ